MDMAALLPPALLLLEMLVVTAELELVLLLLLPFKFPSRRPFGCGCVGGQDYERNAT
jgi:hypothetical protein